MEIRKKVLVGVDLNFETAYILSAAAALFGGISPVYCVCHVINGAPFSMGMERAGIKTRLDEAAKILESAVKDSGLRYMDCEVYTVSGIPSIELLELAAKQDVSLIIVGTHQKIGLKEFISGSVSFSIAKNSFCPVLLIPLKNIVRNEKPLLNEPAVSLINNPS